MDTLLSTLAFLSTPSARRATLCPPPSRCHFSISIHALREEGDRPERRQGQGLQISIHALREEGDRHWICNPASQHHFYPRPPRGGRPAAGNATTTDSVFLSTPSARRATIAVCPTTGQISISIHALREEGDAASFAAPLLRIVFLSTPSARRATAEALGYIEQTKFLSTPSARRATMPAVPEVQAGVISIHALREEGDRPFCVQ